MGVEPLLPALAPTNDWFDDDSGIDPILSNESADELPSCCLGSILTSYLELSDPAFIADLNLGLGKEEGKDMLLLNFFIKLLAREELPVVSLAFASSP